MILITKPNFVLGQQATFSHEFEAHNDLRPLQSYRQLACVAKTASTDICQIPGLLRAIFRPIEARYNEDRLVAECAGSHISGSPASKAAAGAQPGVVLSPVGHPVPLLGDVMAPSGIRFERQEGSPRMVKEPRPGPILPYPMPTKRAIDATRWRMVKIRFVPAATLAPFILNLMS